MEMQLQVTNRRSNLKHRSDVEEVHYEIIEFLWRLPAVRQLGLSHDGVESRRHRHHSARHRQLEYASQLDGGPARPGRARRKGGVQCRRCGGLRGHQ
jgi:hypothetical protein